MVIEMGCAVSRWKAIGTLRSKNERDYCMIQRELVYFMRQGLCFNDRVLIADAMRELRVDWEHMEKERKMLVGDNSKAPEEQK